MSASKGRSATRLLGIAAIVGMFMSGTAAGAAWPCGADGADLTCTKSDDGTLTVSGTGAMMDYSGSAIGISAPWGKVDSIVIESGVTRIGNNAFSGNLKSGFPVTVFAENPPAVGERAFFEMRIETAILRVPTSSIAAYSTADVWKDFGYVNPSTVTFDSQSDDDIAAQLVSYGKKATKPTDPTKAEFVFEGWYSEDSTTLWNFDTDAVTSDITLSAKWKSHSTSVSMALRRVDRQSLRASGNTLHLNLSERGNVSIYSLNGARVRAYDLSGGSHALRLNSLPRGTYVVRANSGAWSRAARVLVK